MSWSTVRWPFDRTALRHLGQSAPALLDAEGFVGTGDLIEIKGDRCFLIGRRGGIINVGGAKVNLEDVEAVINLHASVHASAIRLVRFAASLTVTPGES
jgi:non-ribosomal peptide synthetase component E (peptide arylation enzyme)